MAKLQSPPPRHPRTPALLRQARKLRQRIEFLLTLASQDSDRQHTTEEKNELMSEAELIYVRMRDL